MIVFETFEIVPDLYVRTDQCRTTYSLRVADHVSCMIRNMLVRWMSSCFLIRLKGEGRTEAIRATAFPSVTNPNRD